MRIAYFTDTFSPQINGIANTLNYLTNYLKKNKIDHLIFAPDFGKDQKNARPKIRHTL